MATQQKKNIIEFAVFPTQKVTSRKGGGMVCAEYQGSDARVARQTDDYESDEYELKADNDKISIKTDKVSLLVLLIIVAYSVHQKICRNSYSFLLHIFR